ncbi:MAG: hypothetical protein Unbinned4162contig1001_65 [Prokaryotic dsDNA virus sp.]|nr:MAG: hypothetical protein Unbinned4162contig1001_65 [Prokaryotic dsDNA virus sp.]|tara:strand:- start:44344 stop:44742 length:399 start_codon:yes stop_codon:yes gene_type:complete
MKEFFTRQKAEEGVSLPLQTPDGKDSEHKLTVRGVDSDVYRQAEFESKRKAAEIAQIEDLKDRYAAMRDEQRRLVAVLIIDWTFEAECTMENKIEFLTNAPQIEDVVNRFAGTRQAFFSKRSSSSTSGQKQK